MTEYRLIGVLYIAGGVLLGIVAVVIQEPAAAVAELLLTGAFFSTCMYVLVLRRFAGRAVRAPSAAPTKDREPLKRTRRRAALSVTPALAFIAVVGLLVGTPALVAGIAAGNGAALVWTSRWLRRWEHEHQRMLLREPRWRWSREGRRGWGRGRGIVDPQDFYVIHAN